MKKPSFKKPSFKVVRIVVRTIWWTILFVSECA